MKYNNKQSQGDFRIENLTLLSVKSSEKGTECNASFLIKGKDGKAIINIPFSIYVNGLPAQTEQELVTKEHGFATVNFLSRDEKIVVMVIVIDDNDKITSSTKKLTLVEKEKKSNLGNFTHATVITPETSSKFANILEDVANITAHTAGAWSKLENWLAKKSEKQKSHFITAITKMNKDQAADFLRRFIRLDNDEERDKLAKNFSLAPQIDFQIEFVSRMKKYTNSGSETNKKKSSRKKFEKFFQKLPVDLAENFMINACFLSDDKYAEIFDYIICSEKPLETARNLGMINKPKT